MFWGHCVKLILPLTIFQIYDICIQFAAPPPPSVHARLDLLRYPVDRDLFTSFSSVLPTSQVGYHAGKPIEIVVYCFFSIIALMIIENRAL